MDRSREHMPDISVIIPVYNAEKYVSECIESVKKQTLQNLEILCIDDGSVDGTLRKIEALRVGDKRIRILTQRHMGAGSARNYGIAEAAGKYVAFLDADDFYYDETALQEMVESCEKNKVNICGSYRKLEYENNIEDFDLFSAGIMEDNTQGMLVDYRDFQEDYHYQSFVFKREFLIENNIMFPNYPRYQDPPFFLKAMLRAGQFWLAPTFLYCYRYGHQDKNVISKNIKYILMGIRDNLKIALDNDLEDLCDKILSRLDTEYYSAILLNLSDECVRLLLDIGELVLKNGISRKMFVMEEMKKVVMLQQNIDELKRFFAEQKISRVSVYGVGLYGKILIGLLEQAGIDIVCCIDREVTKYENYCVRKPMEEAPDCDAILISLLCPEEVVEMYQERGIKNAITFKQIADTVCQRISQEKKDLLLL